MCVCSVLHVERQWLNVGHRAHSPDAAAHLPLDVLQGFALRLRHVHYHEHQTDHAHRAEQPEGAVRSNGGNNIGKGFRHNERARPVEGSGN